MSALSRRDSKAWNSRDEASVNGATGVRCPVVGKNPGDAGRGSGFDEPRMGFRWTTDGESDDESVLTAQGGD